MPLISAPLGHVQMNPCLQAFLLQYDMTQPHTTSSQQFKNPIPGLTSPEPTPSENIELVNVQMYWTELPKGVSAAPVRDASYLPKSRCAYPYESDPYDKLMQVKHQANMLFTELMELEVYTETELNYFFLKEDKERLLTRILTNSPIPEYGILRDFSFNKDYALCVSREIIFLISICRVPMAMGDRPSIEGKWILVEKEYFSLFRYIYTSLGKMQALVCYFEQVQSRKKRVEDAPATSNKTEYLKDVKKILLELLDKQAKNNVKKYKTITAALHGIQSDFEILYENLQKTANYDCLQQYFNSENLVRNFRTWQREDTTFKKAISDYINL